MGWRMGRAECLVGQVNLSWMNGIDGGKWSEFSFVGGTHTIGHCTWS